LNQIAWIQDAQLPISSQMAVRGEYFDNKTARDWFLALALPDPQRRT